MRSDVTALGPFRLQSPAFHLYLSFMCRFFTFHFSYDLPFSGGLNVVVATASAGVCYGEHWEA